MKRKKIAIIGAGPGGLTSAMLLSHKGFDVSVFERNSYVGGRNAAIKERGYSFDIGPTFLMMTFILKQVFEESGKRIEDYLKITPLDPMYKLSFRDKEIFPSANREKMEEQIAKLFPGDIKGLAKFHRKENIRYNKMYPCLQKDYSTLSSMFSKPLLKALPYLSLTKTLFKNLSSYFKDEELKISFTFQAKYLGMSPWECPAAFTIIPYIEHTYGIDHTEGGLSAISDAMAKASIENGAKIHLSTPVKRIIIKNKKAIGVELSGGERKNFDAVFINADFGYAMTNLFEEGAIKKYSAEKLEKKNFSCSTFMLYLGANKIYNEPHHHIIFADDYKKNIQEVAQGTRLSEDFSVYVRNASINDATIAPKGKSAIYVLIPVPNNRANIQWTAEGVKRFRDKAVKIIESRTSMKDLSAHIEYEKIITPPDWEKEYNVYKGATFNLGHNVSQMLYFRPRNRFEEVKNCYLVGGGTHPGSGLPTIYESARISSSLAEIDLSK